VLEMSGVVGAKPQNESMNLALFDISTIQLGSSSASSSSGCSVLNASKASGRGGRPRIPEKPGVMLRLGALVNACKVSADCNVAPRFDVGKRFDVEVPACWIEVRPTQGTEFPGGS